MRRLATLAYRCLSVVGVVCLGTWAGVTLLARAANAHNTALLDRLIRERRGGVAISGGGRWGGAELVPPRSGELLGRVDVPSVEVSTVILEGTGERVLEQAAGHVPGTALPGAPGNVVLAAHRDSYFRNLRHIAVGDIITLTTPALSRTYEVDSIRVVSPTHTAVLAPSVHDRLTLVTCYPFDYVGAAPHRFVVQASAVGTPRPATLAERWKSLAGAVHHAPQASHRRALIGQADRRRFHRSRFSTNHASARRSSPATTASPPPTKPPKKLPWWKRFFHHFHRVHGKPARGTPGR